MKKVGFSKIIISIIVFQFIINCGLFAQNLKLYHIDVDQGDATLVVSPSGRSLLIDSGRNGHGSRIKSVLDQEGIRFCRICEKIAILCQRW